MRSLLALAAVLFATVASGKDSSVLVPRVNNIVVTRDGGKVFVTATATVSTAGWKNARLVKIDPATFAFRAVPPEGMAAQVISTLTAKAEVKSKAKAVTVKAQRNALQAPLKGR